jgi:hypothetical protein
MTRAISTALLAAAVLMLAAAPARAADDVMGQCIADARFVFKQIQDYTCTFVKQERVDGQLLPEQGAVMKVRQQPFSVHVKLVAPASAAGREACYVAGKHGDKIRAKAGGLFGAVGFVTLEKRDPRVMKQNRHTLDEAGLGHLIDRLAASHAREKNLPGVTVTAGEYMFANRPCVRVETAHTRRHQGIYAARCVTYFDKETRLPVRFEAYDWPGANGGSGDLLECYSYINLQFNTGLTDAAFAY